MIATLALLAATGGAATVALELRYGVPARAVVRYFTRLHDRAPDLRPLLAQAATMARIEGLALGAGSMNPGGMVYSVDGALEFHPWLPANAAAADRRWRQRDAIYTRLLESYLKAELDELLADLLHPEVRNRLQDPGLPPAELLQLRRHSAEEQDPRRRRRLLRRASRFILPFAPRPADRYRLNLGDKLEFYGSRSPRGRFLALYEVRHGLWPAPAAAGPPATASRTLLITRMPDGSIVLDDWNPERLRRYWLTPVPHPAGLPLYRLAPRA